MKTINDYFDDLKEKTGSDYATAKRLGIGKSSLSTIRSRGQMADETAIKVADLLEIDRSEVLLAATIARSHGDVKKAWMNISKHAGIAASVAIATAFTLANTSAGIDLDKIQSITKSVYYVKL